MTTLEPTHIYASAQQLEDGVRYWRAVLGLRDWTIKAMHARYHEFSDDHAGYCSVHPEHRFARIWILASEDHSPDAVFAEDQELTLVHELLHIHYAPLQPEESDERSSVLMEQSINAISEALVRLRRANASP